MKDVLLTPEKAAVVGNTAVIADLHLGFENVLQERGYALPRLQLKEIKKQVKNIVEKYDISKIVIAGDLKHEFSKNLPYEWEDVREFIESVEVELEVVRGNHDNYLAAILADYGIELKEKVNVGDFTVVHGHREFDGEKIIMGHEHPAVKIRVRGALYSFPCYLVADSSKIVLPAFSPLMAGSDVLQGNFLSPILQKAKKIEVYAVEEDVVYLGSVEDLKKVL